MDQPTSRTSLRRSPSISPRSAPEKPAASDLGSGGGGPKPGGSGARTRNGSASDSTCRDHVAAPAPQPCTSTTGRPTPLSSTCTSAAGRGPTRDVAGGLGLRCLLGPAGEPKLKLAGADEAGRAPAQDED